MTQTFDLNIDINSVQWIRSLRAGEESWNQKIVDDVEAECKRQGMAFSLHDGQTIAEFERVLRALEREAADKGVRPLIHIDMHGGKDAGLEIAGEGKCIAWPQVADLLSAVNIAADRNLCVVSASAHDDGDMGRGGDFSEKRQPDWSRAAGSKPDFWLGNASGPNKKAQQIQ